MRVLILGQYFWPENFRINEIAETLCRAGCSVAVLTGPPNYPDGMVFPGYSAARLTSEMKGGIPIYRVPMIPRGDGSALRLLMNYLSFVITGCLFAPWMLRKHQFDVILVYAPGPILQAIPALWLKSIKRAKVVTWVQDLWPESLEVTGFVTSKFLLRIVAGCVKWIYRRSDLLLVQSQSFVEPVRALAGFTPVIYHPNPGELASGERVSSDYPAVKLRAGFNVVFAGNLGTVQALDTILNAAESTRSEPDIWWVLVGSGSRSVWLQQEVERRNLQQVLLPGRFPPDQMHAIFDQASVLLVSLVKSQIMSQTVPSKVQAYLAAGKPIIASLDGEGARIVAEAGAGITCPAEDAASLRDAVMQMRALSPAQRASLGEAGRQYYANNFDPVMLTERLIGYFSNLTPKT
jgi:glycosyltransferase involved in cell wall biosynthesis